MLRSHVLRLSVFEIHVTAKWVTLISSVMSFITTIRHDAAKSLAATDVSEYASLCRRRQGANFWSSVAVRQKMYQIGLI